MNKKKCPICGTEMKIDTSAVCASIPPMYRCVCPSCNYLDFIKTSEYDQYKEEPSLPSDLDEAAILAAQYDMQDRQIMGASNDDRMRYSRIFRRGFKAGAEWQKKRFEAEYELDWITDLKKDLYELGRKDEREQMMKDAVEGEVVKDISNKLAVTAKINLVGFKFGQKVKIIILKDNETIND